MACSTTTPIDLYGRLAARFTEVADAAEPSRWDDPSPCDDWTARDVLAHVLDTQRDFLDRNDLDPGPRPDLAVPAAAWRTHRDAVRELLDRPGVADRAYDSLFGSSTIGATLARFYGFDMVVHRWDLARALGTDTDFDDDELDLLEDSLAAFGETLYTDGVCGPVVPIADDAPQRDRILATTGRDPTWTPQV